MLSPLGRYSDLAATIVGVGTVVTWLGVHALLIVAAILGAPTIAPGATEQLDLAGVAALGLILGQRVTTNGAAALAAAQGLRLDAMGAPSTARAREIVTAVAQDGTPGSAGASGAH